MPHLPTIAICGPGRSGKDEAARWLAANTPLRLGPTTSQVIAPHVAARLGLDVASVFEKRHENRQLWFEIGNCLRETDPAFLVRECLAKGDIAVGLRNADEVMAARAERLVDLFVWIDREVPPDPTQTFGAELCDVIVSNRGSLDEFFLKLMTLARFGRLI